MKSLRFILCCLLTAILSGVVSAVSLAADATLPELLARGQELRNQGKVEDAIATFRQAAKLCRSDTELVQIQLNLGFLYMQAGRRAEALQSFLEVAQRTQRISELEMALQQIATIHLWAGDVRQAVTTLEELLKRIPLKGRRRRAVQLQIARACRRRGGDLRRAASIYEGLLKEDLQPSERTQVVRDLAQVYIALSTPNLAEDLIKTQAQAGLDLSDLFGVLVDLRRRRGDLAGAMALCQTQLARKPEDQNALRLLYDLHKNRGSLADLVGDLRRQAKAAGAGSWAQRWLADVLLWNGQQREAAEAYARWAAAQPESARTLVQAGWRWREAGDYDRAVAALARALELEPENAGTARMLGEAYADRGDGARALEAWQRATQYRPGNLEAARRLCQLLSSHSLNREALGICRQTRAARQEDSILCREAGRAQEGLGDYAAAVEEYLKALVAGGAEAVWCRSELRRLAGEGGQRELVLQQAERARRQAPASRELLNFLAQEYAAGGRLSEALQVLQTPGGTTDPQWTIEIAGRLASDCDYQTAESLYARAAEAQPDGPVRFRALTGRAACLGQLGRWAEAAKAALQALKSARGAAQEQEILVFLGDVYLLHTKQLDLAQELFQRLGRAGGIAAEYARRGLADLHFFRAEWDRAQAGYQQMLDPGANPIPLPGSPQVLRGLPPGALLLRRGASLTGLPSRPLPGADYAQFQLAEIALRRADFPAAKAQFSAFAERYADSDYCNEALERLQLLNVDFLLDPLAARQYVEALVALDRGDVEAGEAAARKLAEQSGSPLADDALVLLAQKREQRGDLRGAVEVYREMARRFPRSPALPQALLRAARVLGYGMGNFRGAQELLAALADEHPDSSLVDAARTEMDALRRLAARRPGPSG